MYTREHTSSKYLAEWPDCVFNIWPFTAMKICPKANKLYQSELKILPKAKHNLNKFLNIRQSSGISPNLITLVFGASPFPGFFIFSIMFLTKHRIFVTCLGELTRLSWVRKCGGLSYKNGQTQRLSARIPTQQSIILKAFFFGHFSEDFTQKIYNE